MVNKWDLIEKDTQTADKFKKEMQEKLAPIDYIPYVFASVLTKQRIFQVIEKAVQVYENKTKRIPTSTLNDSMLPEIVHYPPAAIKGKHIQIKYITQVPGKSPAFAFFCNLATVVAIVEYGFVLKFYLYYCLFYIN